MPKNPFWGVALGTLGVLGMDGPAGCKALLALELFPPPQPIIVTTRALANANTRMDNAKRNLFPLTIRPSIHST
jgi:hypothetical protein